MFITTNLVQTKITSDLDYCNTCLTGGFLAFTHVLKNSCHCGGITLAAVLKRTVE